MINEVLKFAGLVRITPISLWISDFRVLSDEKREVNRFFSPANRLAGGETGRGSGVAAGRGGKAQDAGAGKLLFHHALEQAIARFVREP